MNSELLQGFYLGDLLVEPLNGQVSDHNGSRHLPPKAVEVLLCLANDATELVTRDTLLDAVWGEGHGSQEALGHAISEIRHALDDHSDDPHFIQTLPRRGYRLAVIPVPVADHADSIVIGVDTTVSNIGLFENLKRRGVFETALAYLIVGWLLIQVADIVFSQLHFPSWSATFVTVFVIAGFPIAVILSWFLEYRDGRAVLHEASPIDLRRRRFGRTYLSVIGALAAASLLVFVYDRQIGLPEAPAASGSIQDLVVAENTIAVLPLLNNDGSDETQVFANGLTDDVITDLSRVPGLLVASRGDSFTLEPNSASSLVRQRLRVAMYVEGSVEIAGDRIRVIVQLIDSATGFHVLSRRFDRPREDFFDIRDEVTELTVASVRPALPPDTQSITSIDMERPTLDAYMLYRRGIEASRLPNSIDNVSSALGWFDASLNIDPDYAAAHAGKCTVYANGYSEVDDSAFIDNAEAACGTALELNPNLDIVHTALGQLYLSTGRYDEAVASFERALEINPTSSVSLIGLGDVYLSLNQPREAEASLRQAIGLHPGEANAYNRLGFFLYQTGRYAEALEQYQQVIALNPDDMNAHSNLGTTYMLIGDFEAAALEFQKAIDITPKTVSYSNLGLIHYYLGDMDAAIDSMQRSVKLEPNDHLARSNLGDVLWTSGRTDEAIATFEHAQTLARSALDVNPNDPYSLMDLAWIEAMLGNSTTAREMMDKSLRLAPDEPYAHYYNALILVRAGEPDAALTALEQSIELGYSNVMAAAEPHFAELRSDPRFIAMVE